MCGRGTQIISRCSMIYRLGWGNIGKLCTREIRSRCIPGLATCVYIAAIKLPIKVPSPFPWKLSPCLVRYYLPPAQSVAIVFSLLCVLRPYYSLVRGCWSPWKLYSERALHLVHLPALSPSPVLPVLHFIPYSHSILYFLCVSPLTPASIACV